MYEKTGPGALVLYVARSLSLAQREVGKKSLVPPRSDSNLDANCVGSRFVA